MSAGDVVALVVVLLVLAVLLGACILVMRASWRLLVGPRRSEPRRPILRSPPDDWDDEEYSARHHH